MFETVPAKCLTAGKVVIQVPIRELVVGQILPPQPLLKPVDACKSVPYGLLCFLEYVPTPVFIRVCWRVPPGLFVLGS